MMTFEVKAKKKSFQDCSRDDCDSCPGNVPIEDGECPDEFMCDDNDDCYR